MSAPAQLEPQLEKALESKASPSGWKLPFFLLLVVIGGLSGFAYKKYRHLTKTHLL